MLNKYNFSLPNVIFFLVISLPMVSIFGSFLADFFLSLSSLLFLIHCLIKKNYKYFKNIFFIIFLIWYFYLVVLSLTSKYPLLSLQSSLFYIRFGVFVLCVYYLILNYKEFLKFFCLSLLITFVFLTLNSFFQYFFYFDFLGNKYDGIRLSSVFGEKKILGSYLSRLAPLFIGLTFIVFKNNNKIIYLSLIIFVFIDLLVYFSGERAALFNLLFFSLILIFFTNSFKRIRVIALFISIVLISLLSLYNKTTFERMITKTIQQTNIMNDKPNLFSIQHQVIYLTSFKIFKDHYIFGIGPKNFREFCSSEKYKTYTNLDNSVDGCQSHPHNFYVQLLVETGPLGTLPIIVLYIFLSYIFFKHFYYLTLKNKMYLNDNFVIISSSLLINFWPFIPTGNFFNNYVSFLIYLPLGFVIYMIQEKNYKN